MWILKNKDTGLFYAGYPLDDTTVSQSFKFKRQPEAIDVGLKLRDDCGLHYLLSSAECLRVGRHGETWREVGSPCDICAAPATFADPTFDRETCEPGERQQYLCHDCAKHQIEMSMMAMSEVKQ